MVVGCSATADVLFIKINISFIPSFIQYNEILFSVINDDDYYYHHYKFMMAIVCFTDTPKCDR